MLKTGKGAARIQPDAMEKLLLYDWPGNVRELKNAIEYASVLCKGGDIQVSHLPPRIVSPPGSKVPRNEEAEESRQRESFLRLLRECGGNQSETARRLGVSRVTVWKRIKKFRIDLKSDL